MSVINKPFFLHLKNRLTPLLLKTKISIHPDGMRRYGRAVPIS